MYSCLKRISAQVTAILLILCLLILPASAEEAAASPAGGVRTDETGAWQYTLLEDGTAMITGFTSTKDQLVFPETVDGIQVTVIGRDPDTRPDYTVLRAVKKVTLPKGLKAIGDYAFDTFASLAVIKLPDGVESIGDSAFRGCRSLQSLAFPRGIRTIGSYAFYDCRKLGASELPKSLESIGDYAFSYCVKLGKVTFPAALKSIGAYAYANSGLTSVKLNDGLETVGEKAFYMHKMKEISIPASVKKAGNAAFAADGNKVLKTVTVNSAKMEFGRGVFGYNDGWDAYYNANRTTAKSSDYDRENPDNWSDYYADYNYNKLGFGQVTLALSCHAGSTADKLYRYHVTKTHLKKTELNTVTAPADPVLSAGLYHDEDLIDELIVPEGVTEIGEKAFAGLSTLSSVTLPSTLTKLGDGAFENCIALKKIRLPDSLTEIGKSCFSGCVLLPEISLPAGVTDISDSAFEGCAALKKVGTARNAVIRRIGRSAFSGCAALKEIRLAAGLEEIGEQAFSGAGITDLKLPDTVTVIGKRAFFRSSLISLKLPAGLTEIPERLCELCSKLGNLTLPTALTKIGKRAFAQTGLKALKLPNSLREIGEEAFAFDTALVQSYHLKNKKVSVLGAVAVPASVEVIQARAFQGCDAMTSLTFARGSVLREIGEEAFDLCFSLRKAELPDSVQTVGNAAFRDCRLLSSVNLGNGITSVGKEAFKHCSALAQFIVPDSLTEIGEDLLLFHGSKLKVTCSEESAMYAYLQAHYRDVKVNIPKKKK
ncbi:MAG: leucine-rich repeat domain-containing protein [Clostridia bacterium]|nr:leucine-rich repeat domain-containing protein [Clostridia bacterium]